MQYGKGRSSSVSRNEKRMAEKMRFINDICAVPGKVTRGPKLDRQGVDSYD